MSGADDFFNEGAPSAIATIKRLGDKPGTTIGGTIVDIGNQVQQKDDEGNPASWPDGNPKMLLPVTVATELRDPEIPDDDGHRTFWVSGNLKKAIGSALRAAKAKLAVGGVLQVTFTGFGEAKNKMYSAPRLWTAVYAPPAPAAGFFEEPAQPVAAAHVGPPPAPVAQPAPAATPAGVDPVQWAAFQASQAQAQAQAAPAAPALDATNAAYAAQMGFQTPGQ